MATELTYSGDSNRVVADATSANNATKWTTWYIVQSLLGQYGLSAPTGAWTTYYSCDGTAGGTGTPGDGIDRWGSTYNITKLLWNCDSGTGSGGPFSWFVLRSPIGFGANGSEYHYLTVSLSYFEGTAYTVLPAPYFVFSKTAPTGGTRFARPTAVDEVVHPSVIGNTPLVTTPSAIIFNYVSMFLSTRGDFFFYVTNTGGSSSFRSFLFCLLTENFKAADLYPVISFYFGNGQVAAQLNNTTGGGTKFWYSTPLAGGGSSMLGRTYDGSAVMRMASAYPTTTAGNMFNVAIAGNANQSDGTFNEWYCPVFSAQPNPELKGRLPDIKAASDFPAVFTVRPATPSPNYDYVKMGALWLPWPAPMAPVF